MIGSGTVYVVDDDPAIRDSMRQLITATGLAVETFACERDFLARTNLGEVGNDPSCVLLDLRMPGVGGRALMERLRKEGITTPIIIVTADADAMTTARAIKSGAICVVEKPFRPDVLLARVDEALRLDDRMRRERSGRVAPQSKLSCRSIDQTPLPRPSIRAQNTAKQ